MNENFAIHNNMNEWLLKNKDEFKPPISNKIMFNDQLIIFFLKGPNSRPDFHIENGEEIFYMIEGNINLKVVLNGQFQDIKINEGEIFVLPPRVIHSPRRPENTLGFVIERKRQFDLETDGLIFFDETPQSIKHVVYEYIEDTEHQLRKTALKATDDVTTGNVSSNNSKRNDPPIKSNDSAEIINPTSLKRLIEEKKETIHKNGSYKLLPENYQSKIEILSNGENKLFDECYDTILWLFKGNASLVIDSDTIHLHESDFYFLKAGKSATLTILPDNFVLKMNMTNH